MNFENDYTGFTAEQMAEGQSDTITMERPLKFGLSTMVKYCLPAIAMGLIGLIDTHGALAQSSASAPVFGATVQGQSASTVEGTLGGVVSYIGNVICPLSSAGFVAHGIYAYRSGKGHMASFATAGGLLMVSGVMRLIENMVTNGQAAVK